MSNNIKKYWDNIIYTLKEELNLSDVSFRTWIKPLQISEIKNNTIIFNISRDEVKDYIKNKYGIQLKTIINRITNSNYEILFLSPNDKNIINKLTKQKQKIYNGIIKEYTFDSFIVGKSNEFAQAAALAVAESPSNSPYNPLFIYSNSGLGKTHLMHAIANYVLEHDDKKKILYITSETFTNEVITAIRTNTINKLRDKYRNVDVLLLDDIQFIIGKNSTQEEFFHTFNDLYSKKKAIIISSDKPPKNIELLDERYRSRFEWGLVADINYPDYETKIAILKKKIEKDNLTNLISDDILNYIATKETTNIRELEGCLKKLIAYSRLNNTNISLSLTKYALKDIIPEQEMKKEITINYIISTVCAYYNLDKKEIISKKRTKELVLIRQIIMFLSRKLTDSSFTKIGKELGKKNHATVDYSIKQITQKMKSDKNLVKIIENLKNKII